MFFFDSFFNQALAAMTSTINSVQGVAYAILGITFLLSVYEAFGRGGDTRQLMIGFLKYVVAAVVIQNWPAVFNDLHTTMEAIAYNITTQDYASLWQSNWSTWMAGNPDPLITIMTASWATIVQDAILVVIDIVYGVALMIFDFMYALWGCVLYVLAPLLIALLPSIGLAGFSKKFLSGLAEWCMWPILYAVFAAMAYDMNSADITSILASKSYVDIISNTTNMLLIGTMSLVIALCLLIIPFLAHFLIGASFDGVAAGAITMAKIASGNVAAAGSSAGGAAAGATGGGSAAGEIPTISGTGTPNGGGRQTTYTNSLPPPSSTPLQLASGELIKNNAIVGHT
jgi:hypothetical protein